MPLVPMRSILEHARTRHYAVGYFESWNMESILSVIDAAERTASPVIIGFGGMFLGNPQRAATENIAHYGALGRAVAEASSVPTSLLLNEADQVSMLIKSLNSGFNAVMYQDPAASFMDTVATTRYLTRTAHYLGADVEAEVGELPHANIATDSVHGGSLTDPEQAAYFVEQTGIDALAVAIGNVHLLENGKSSLNFDLVEQIKRLVSIPLVLHGGTGICEEDIKHAIDLGMCKINVGTSLKRTCLKYMQQYLDENDLMKTDPHDVVGRGGPKDILTGAREAMSEEVVCYIKIFGCENQAKYW